MAPNRGLEGRVALVTGSTRGIGWACAAALAESGATVLVNGVSDQAAVDARVRELAAQYGVPAAGFRFDVSDAPAVKECYASIQKTYGRLDILVNNAGIMQDALLGMISGDAIDRTLAVNVKGVILNTQYAARLMARAGRGSIVNMTSIMGRVGNEGQILYAASKAAVIGLTRSAAKELGGQGIRVNAVAPGLIETDMIAKLTPDKRAALLAAIRMKRPGTPEDVARAVLFLASDPACYVTGQVLGVDGGLAW